jgi:hypothetical protein
MVHVNDTEEEQAEIGVLKIVQDCCLWILLSACISACCTLGCYAGGL